SAGDVEDLAGDVIGAVRSEKADGAGDVVGGRRAANGRAGVADTASFVGGKAALVDVGRIHHVDGDAVLGFFDRKRAREGDDGGFRGGVGGDGALSKRAFGTDC